MLRWMDYIIVELLREAMRGCSSDVSPFHRRRSRSFLGGSVACLDFWGFCLLCFAFHDFEVNLVVMRS